MDNVTHTLISALVGEAVHRSTAASSTLSARAHRGIAIGVMVVGGNLPDADLVHTQWAGTTLDYLLHHRGYSHTVLGVLLQSLLLFGAVRLGWRLRAVRPSAADVRMLLLVAVLAPLLHVGLDFTNSYGVHPFWPVDDRWFYGDAVFIVEPLLWACAAPLVGTLRGRVARVLVAVVLVVGVGLGWGSGLVPVPFAALLTVLVVGLVAVGRRASPGTAVTVGIVAWLAVTGTFVATGRWADARVAALLADRFPAERTLDTVLTPMPANPVCREVLTVGLAPGRRYVVRSGTHSLLPAWMPAGRCAPLRYSGTPSAPLVPVAQPGTAEMVWAGELSMPRGEPAALAPDHCVVAALLQFARVPFAVPRGERWLVGDLRYDREPDLGFAEIEVAAEPGAGAGGHGCPRLGAPWVPPRRDLLDGG